MVKTRNPKPETRNPPAHPPIGEAEGKRAQVEAMFDAIAPRYDLLNRLLSFGIDQWWRREAVRAIAPLRPRHVLDVATGTADLALMAARMMEPERVVGVDIAEQMLRLGRRKVQRRRRSGQIVLKRGDAADLPFEENTFDAALVAFGVRNFEDLEAGLRGIRHVLRPGGTLVVLEFSRPRAPVIRALYRFYSHHVLPRIGRLLSTDAGAYRYLPAPVGAFPDGVDFLHRMQAAGFEELRWRPLTFGVASLYQGRAGL